MFRTKFLLGSSSEGRTTFAGLASAGRTSAGRHLPVWTFAGQTSAGPRHLPVGHLPVGTFAGLVKSNHLGLLWLMS